MDLYLKCLTLEVVVVENHHPYFFHPDLELLYNDDLDKSVPVISWVKDHIHNLRGTCDPYRVHPDLLDYLDLLFWNDSIWRDSHSMGFYVLLDFFQTSRLGFHLHLLEDTHDLDNTYMLSVPSHTYSLVYRLFCLLMKLDFHHNIFAHIRYNIGCHYW